MSRDTSRETWAITGAAGRIGTTLRDGLAPHVASLVLLDTQPIESPTASERAFTIDVADVAALAGALEGVDGVIHLAAIPDEADFHDLAAANLTGTWNVLDAARRAGVRRIVFASTARTMGLNEVGTIVGPTDRVRPDGIYASTKLFGEALCSVFVDKFGFTATCLRIGAFGTAPREGRDLGIWLSPDDAVRAFLTGVRQRADTFEIIIAASENTGGWFDLEPGRHLGYVPEDDATVRAEELGLSFERVAAGTFIGDQGTADYTLSRQRDID